MLRYFLRMIRRKENYLLTQTACMLKICMLSCLMGFLNKNPLIPTSLNTHYTFSTRGWG
jgi:hypothetical protein